MEKDQNILRYEEAAAILPAQLRKLALTLPADQQALAEEFRLRAGRPMTVLLPSGEVTMEVEVEPEELETLCDLATEFSRYAAGETVLYINREDDAGDPGLQKSKQSYKPCAMLEKYLVTVE